MVSIFFLLFLTSPPSVGVNFFLVDGRRPERVNSMMMTPPMGSSNLGRPESDGLEHLP